MTQEEKYQTELEKLNLFKSLIHEKGLEWDEALTAMGITNINNPKPESDDTISIDSFFNK